MTLWHYQSGLYPMASGLKFAFLKTKKYNLKYGGFNNVTSI
jgi:hypothetical protein